MKILTDKIKENLNMIIEYFLLFTIYAVMGWIMEVIIFYFKTGAFVNRGFLIGPYCSIYGFGCILITVLFGKYKDKPFKLFFLSFLACTVFEYVVGYVMEVLFGGRWWQYTDELNPFNINGRVWLVTTLLFGVLATVLITYVEPFFLKQIRRIPKEFLNTCVSVLFSIYILDIIVTSSVVFGIREKLDDIEYDCTTVVSEYVKEEVKKVF